MVVRVSVVRQQRKLRHNQGDVLVRRERFAARDRRVLPADDVDLDTARRAQPVFVHDTVADHGTAREICGACKFDQPFRGHRRIATERAGDPVKGQCAAVRIHVIRQQDRRVEQQCLALADPVAKVGHRNREIGIRQHAQRDLTNTLRAMHILDHIAEPGVAKVIGTRGKDHLPAREGDRTVDRIENADKLKAVALHIHIVRDQGRGVDGDGGILGGLKAAVGTGSRGVVHRREIDHDPSGLLGLEPPVRNRVFKRDLARQIGTRRQRHAPLRQDQGTPAADLLDHGGQRQRIAVRIGVIADQLRRVEVEHRILGSRKAVLESDRGAVGRQDLYADLGGVGAVQVVGQRVAEGRRPFGVRGRGKEDAGGGQFDRSASPRLDGGDTDRVAVPILVIRQQIGEGDQ